MARFAVVSSDESNLGNAPTSAASGQSSAHGSNGKSAGLAKGMRVGQSVILEEKIGEGGMGEVWRGTHESLNRPVAVKIILPQSLADGSIVPMMALMGIFHLDRWGQEQVDSAGTPEHNAGHACLEANWNIPPGPRVRLRRYSHH
jgi:hypothetical protein